MQIIRNRIDAWSIGALDMVTVANSIFRDGVRPSGLGEPRPSIAPTIAIRRPPQGSTVRLETTDARLIAILDAPLTIGETALDGYRRKEVDLGAIMATLTMFEARALHARLANIKHGDELANKFARLTIERRARLLSFLADVRRREALVKAR